MPVYFAVDTRRVGEPALLSALAQVGELFDESPTSMMAVLADSGPIRWLTFRCSVFARGRAMSGGFFEDVLREALPECVMVEIDDLLGTERTLVAWGDNPLRIVSNGSETAIVTGAVPAPVPREGDALTFGLRALDWPTDAAWESFGTRSPRVALRVDRAVVAAPRIERGGAKLPPVGVIVGSGRPGFAYWRDRATERYAIKPSRPRKPRAARSGKVPAVRVDVKVGRTAAMADFSEITRVKGRIAIIDSWQHGDVWGVPEVDLGAVEELVYPGELYVQGHTGAVRAPHLVKADTIHLRLEGDPRVELPLLKTLRLGQFGDCSNGPIGELTLPSLTEVGHSVTFGIDARRFTIRLPALRKGKVTLEAYHLRALDPGSSFEAPGLPASSVTIIANHANTRRALEALVARGTADG